MPYGKLIAIVAAALLFAQFQCVTGCVSQVNQPPCHRHHNCSDRTQVATTTAAASVPMLAITALVPVAAAALPDPLSHVPESRLSPSPPGSGDQTTAVLRI